MRNRWSACRFQLIDLRYIQAKNILAEAIRSALFAGKLGTSEVGLAQCQPDYRPRPSSVWWRKLAPP
jgi:hypothetical protein